MTAASAAAPPPSLGVGARFALVFVGGAVGSLVRFAVVSALPHDAAASPSYAVALVNVLGSFLIGVLATVPLGAASPLPGPAGRVRRLDASGWRLLLGTGVLGGFTTYSAFTLDAFAAATGYGDLLTGWWIWFALGQLLLGVLAALAGMALGGLAGRGRP